MRFLFLLVLTAPMHLLYSQQNLIPNNSLEIYSDCPVSSQELFKATNWFGQSCEYFHSCSPFQSLSTPKNSVGYQSPMSGNAYGGALIIGKQSTYFYPNEFAGIKISKVLDNKWYCGGYFVSLVDGSKKATNALQMYFTKDSLINDLQTWLNRPFPAQITNKNGILLDTLNWMKVEGSFNANGDEKFMQLGCFLDSANNFIQMVDMPGNPNVTPPFGLTIVAYYYFDDAYLYEMGKLPQAQNHAYNCSANTVTLKADTGFNFRWYYLPDTVNVLSTVDTFFVDASSQKNVLLKATLCSTEFTDTLLVPKLDCTSIEDNALAQGAAFFPNPASHIVNFSLQGIPPPGTFLQITDLNGKVLHKQNVTGKNTEVDVGGLSKGVYLVTYHAGNNVIWKEKLCILH